MYRPYDVRVFETPAGRQPIRDFLDALPAHARAAVMSDVELVARYGRVAPVSVKAIKGAQNRGMLEIRTGGYRTFYCLSAGVMWLLHGCRKQDEGEGAGIAVARERMRRLG
jgi:hypothetical protein